MRKGALVWCVLGLLPSCAAQVPCEKVLADARRELMQADTDFSKLSQAQGAADAFWRFMAQDAVSLPAGEEPVRGRDAIRDSLKDLPGTLTWTPVEADAACSNDLGYTWGTYEFRPKGSDKVGRGKYMTVWRRQADGWRAVLDGGNQSPAK